MKYLNLISLSLAMCGSLSLQPNIISASENQIIESKAIELRTSQSLIEMLKNMEGFASYPYWDYGQWTIGYGTKVPLNKITEYKQNGISKTEAEMLLRQHIEILESYVKKFENRNSLSLTQQQFDAVISFTYNCGIGWMKNSTPAKAIINHESEEQIVYAFGLWSTADRKPHRGLIKRRLCEANLFCNGIYSPQVPEDYYYVIFDPGIGTSSVMTQCYMTSTQIRAIPKSQYEFDGWYSDATKKEKINELTPDLSKQTLYAHWKNQNGIVPEEEPYEEEFQELDQAIELNVIGIGVNLRDDPGLKSNRIGIVTKGDKIKITAIDYADNYTWGKTKNGWLALEFTDYKKDSNLNTETETPPEIPSETIPDEQKNEQTEENQNDKVGRTGIVCVDKTLNVRAAAGVFNKLIGKLYNHDTVVITEEKKVDDAQWGKCEKGWIALQYVQFQDDIPDNKKDDKEESLEENTEDKNDSLNVQNETQNTIPSDIKEGWGHIRVSDWLNVRQNPSINSRIVSKLKDGEFVFVQEIKEIAGEKWGKTSDGWISMRYFQFGNESSNENNQHEEKHVHVNSGNLIIRSGPGTQYDVVGLLKNGQSISIQKKNKDNTWGEIDKNKWVCLKYIK